MKYAIKNKYREGYWVASQQGKTVTQTNDLNEVMTFDDYDDCESVCEGLNSQFLDEMEFVVKEFQVYDVEVTRTSTRTTTIPVVAADMKQAERLAMEKAGDIEFPNEKDADYNVNSITLKS